MENTNRTTYFDYLRVFATFAVIILHISAQNWHSANVNSFEWQVFNLFESASRWCVPVFVMISGSLFLRRDIPIKVIYTKYILRLFISFIVWSAIYACFSSDSIEDKLSNFIHGHYHMWFILMIIGLYMCVPIIKPISHSQNISKYYLILAFIFAFIVPESVTLTKDFGSPLAIKIASNLHDSVSGLKMNVVLGFSSYFLLGHYLSNITLSKRQRIVIYLLGLGGFISTVALDSIVSLKLQTPSSHYYGNFTINVLLESVSIFVYFKHKQYHTRRNHIVIHTLSKYSFGTYLVHALIIDQLYIQLGLDTMSFNPILSILLLSVIVFIESFSISAVLNNMPFLNKYIV